MLFILSSKTAIAGAEICGLKHVIVVILKPYRNHGTLIANALRDLLPHPLYSRIRCTLNIENVFSSTECTYVH
jgi:hypothetical protein